MEPDVNNARVVTARIWILLTVAVWLIAVVVLINTVVLWFALARRRARRLAVHRPSRSRPDRAAAAPVTFPSDSRASA